MIAAIRRKLSMATRANDFTLAHPSTDVGYVALATRLGTLVARGDALAVRERDGILAARAAVNRRLQFRSAVTLQLRHLAKVGEAAARTTPALTGLFVTTRGRAPHRTFLTSAKVLLTHAIEHEALLVPLGLGENFVAELTAGVTAFESLSEAANAGRRDHVGARADLTAVADEIMEVVGLLDGLNRARFASTPDLLAAWDSARNVEGPFRRARVSDEVVTPEEMAA